MKVEERGKGKRWYEKWRERSRYGTNLTPVHVHPLPFFPSIPERGNTGMQIGKAGCQVMWRTAWCVLRPLR